ncbi:MAG: NAD(P)/FAD-dependent oxidoreductase [Flavobacteriaceae bacterium]
MEKEVIIIGGGIAGLSAAVTLQNKGINFQLLESSDRVGGRIKTDIIDGFRLDHGFQVLLTAYPEAKQLLDYDALNLKAFAPGSLLLYKNGKKDVLGDPFRDFSTFFPTLFSKAGTTKDKMKVLQLKNRLSAMSVEAIFQQKEMSTKQVLSKEYGFSQQIISQFFTPFFSGIFLEKNLSTSRRMFDFVFKMFGEADTAVPNLGMEEIPKQLKASLPNKAIRTSAKVVKVERQEVHLSDGSTYSAPHIIVATEATSLVGELTKVKKRFESTQHMHFVTKNLPIQKKMIALNTASKRLVNNLCVIDKIAPAYSSNGQHLVSMSIVGNQKLTGIALEQAIKKEMTPHFGTAVADWELLHKRTVKYALPNQKNVRNQLKKGSLEIQKGLYVAGDHQLNGSINAAMKAGREAGELVASKFGS